MLLLNPYRFSVAAAGPTFRAAGALNSQATSTSTSHSVPIPAGAQVGDRAFLALWCHSEGDQAKHSTPAGWTLVHQQTGIKILTKVIADGEPGTNVTITCSSNRINRSSAMIGVYTPATVANVAGFNPTMVSMSHTMPSVTTTGSNKRIVYMTGWDGAGATATTLGSVTGETGGDWVIDAVADVSSGGIAFVSDDKTVAGTITGGTATFNNTMTTIYAVRLDLS